MSTLIILRGNSGSGKSSVAKALQRKIGRNTLMIPQDAVRREMLYVRDGKDTEAIPLLINLLHYGNAPLVEGKRFYRYHTGKNLYGGYFFGERS